MERREKRQGQQGVRWEGTVLGGMIEEPWE